MQRIFSGSKLVECLGSRVLGFGFRVLGLGAKSNSMKTLKFSRLSALSSCGSKRYLRRVVGLS